MLRYAEDPILQAHLRPPGYLTISSVFLQSRSELTKLVDESSVSDD